MAAAHPTTDMDPDAIVVSAEAPAGSHVKNFTYIDRKFTERGEPSELWVTFKERVGKKGGFYPETTYRYDFKDHTTGRMIFERMSIAMHPGEIIWETLIRPNVDYWGPL